MRAAHWPVPAANTHVWLAGPMQLAWAQDDKARRKAGQEEGCSLPRRAEASIARGPTKALKVGSRPTPRDPHHRAAHSQQASQHGALTVKSAASSQARVTGPKRRKRPNTSHQSVAIPDHRLNGSERQKCSCNFHAKKQFPSATAEEPRGPRCCLYWKE